jgi:hypothetical protein
MASYHAKFKTETGVFLAKHRFAVAGGSDSYHQIPTEDVAMEEGKQIVNGN